MLREKFCLLIRNPGGVLRRRIGLLIDSYRYRTANGYDAARYWHDRLGNYQFDLRGVGNEGLNHDENARDYIKAAEFFLTICCEQGVQLAKSSVLEIGCGAGFYAGIVATSGGTDYLGIDITDALFPKLQERFNGFRFHHLDISQEQLTGEFDVIVMIDVTQHITDHARFSFAMQNVRSHLKENGVFIVTSWLDEHARQSFYEVSRPLAAYRREFPGYQFSNPVPFRDKYIFTVRTQTHIGLLR